MKPQLILAPVLLDQVRLPKVRLVAVWMKLYLSSSNTMHTVTVIAVTVVIANRH